MRKKNNIKIVIPCLIFAGVLCCYISILTSDNVEPESNNNETINVYDGEKKQTSSECSNKTVIMSEEKDNVCKYKNYRDAFYSVLMCEDKMHDVNCGGDIYITEYDSSRSEPYWEEGDIDATRLFIKEYGDELTFSIIDLDEDGECEVFIYNPREQRLILHYMNGRIYGYGEVFRGIQGIKKNGYYLHAGSGGIMGYAHISGFSEDEVKWQFLVWQDAHWQSQTDEVVSYFYCGEYDHSNLWKGELFGGEQITEEQYLKIVDDVYESSPDVEVYELTEENIELFFE